MPTPTKQDIKSRIRDEVHGVRPGMTRVPLTGEKTPEPEAPLPDITDLELDHSERRAIEKDVAAHVELGKVERDAAEQKKVVTERLKRTIGDMETQRFYCQSTRVTYGMQRRRNFSEETCKAILKSHGVKAAVIDAAFSEAVKFNEFPVLRVTPPGEEE